MGLDLEKGPRSLAHSLSGVEGDPDPCCLSRRNYYVGLRCSEKLSLNAKYLLQTAEVTCSLSRETGNFGKDMNPGQRGIYNAYCNIQHLLQILKKILKQK